MSITWNEMIQDEMEQDYYKNGIKPFLQQEYNNYTCYPAKENIFRAFYSIPSPEDVKVVILGQDPYHEPNQANGLAFSVNKGRALPPSLNNIFAELTREYPLSVPSLIKTFTETTKEHPSSNEGVRPINSDLTYWANQGVLLLNATLTVREHMANSHKDCGWQIFTDNIIKRIDSLNQPIVYMLWGGYAKKKQSLITSPKALILTSAHPSPLSAHRGFFGCNHFIKCNEYLKQNGLSEINWIGE